MRSFRQPVLLWATLAANMLFLEGEGRQMLSSAGNLTGELSPGEAFESAEIAAMWSPEPKIAVYALSLDRRREEIGTFLASVGFVGENVNILHSIVPDQQYIENLQANLELLEDIRLTPPEIGCKMTHLLALRTFLDGEYEYALIFEDDVALNSTLMNKFSLETSFEKGFIQHRQSLNIGKAIERLASTSKKYNWSALNLGRCFDQCWNDEELGGIVLSNLDGDAVQPEDADADTDPEDSYFKIVNSTRPGCTHGYLITREGAKRVIEWAHETKNRMSADNGMIAMHRKTSTFNYLSLTPRLFQQNEVNMDDSIHINNGETEECVTESALNAREEYLRFFDYDTRSYRS